MNREYANVKANVANAWRRIKDKARQGYENFSSALGRNEDLDKKLAFIKDQPWRFRPGILYNDPEFSGVDTKVKYDNLKLWMDAGWLETEEAKFLHQKFVDEGEVGSDGKPKPFHKMAENELLNYVKRQSNLAAAEKNQQARQYRGMEKFAGLYQKHPKLATALALYSLGMIPMKLPAAEQTADNIFYSQNHQTQEQVVGKANADGATITLDLKGINTFTGDTVDVLNYVAKLQLDGAIVDSTQSGDSTVVKLFAPTTDVKGYNPNLPGNFKLEQNYPNPFNPTTNIEFMVNEHGPVTLDVYNTLGQKIKTLVSQDLEPGRYRAMWAGENDAGNPVGQGVYLYRLTSGDEQQTKKMVSFGGGSGKSEFGYIGGPSAEMAKKNAEGNALTPYQILILGQNATRPPILDKTFLIDVSKDTAIKEYVTLALKPPRWDTPLDDIVLKEDVISGVHGDLWDHVSYVDDDGNPVPDSALAFSFVNPDSSKAILDIVNNRYTELRDLAADSNGTVWYVIRATAPNGAYADADQKVIIRPMRDIKGTVLDNHGNPADAYVMAINANGDTVIARTGQAYSKYPVVNASGSGKGKTNPQADNAFHLQMNPSDGDTLRARLAAGGGWGTPIYIAGLDDTTGNLVVAPTNYRLVTLNFEDYFKGTPVDSVYVKTSMDSGKATAGRTFKASFDEEHIAANGPRHLRSGLILAPGTLDSTLLHYLANADTSDQGLDTAYFEGLVTPDIVEGGYRRNTIPSKKYVALTDSSVKDTIWILGNIPALASQGYINVDQLNATAQFFNDTLKMMTTTKNDTDGYFGENRRIIAIADSNFAHPDSVAKFAYSNMHAVPQGTAPLDLEVRRDYIIVRPANSNSNGTFFMPDSLTVRGGDITINKGLSKDAILNVMGEEALSMILGGVESAIFYPSLYDTHAAGIYPQDLRRQQFITFRGPGRVFPDLPKGFNP
ncbi:MAG: hypothetical protein QS98_C0007G0023 [archaeon GW2011_AR3]|nr:MAG: hypothetical protein QS98_C0007G0023 [archaeon GW2011_AR3]MBS3108934.1 T9SS type A sorting domain-containing protein [Candidatus Woesearchaeota archaeon]